MKCFSNSVLCAVLACTLASGIASAAPSPADIATARSLVVEGRKLRQAGEFGKAVEKLQAAFTLYRTPVTGHELALAHRDASQLIEAREIALLVVKMPVESDEGKASETARAECAKMVTELAPKIAKVTLTIVNLPAGSTPMVTIDGDAVVVFSEPRLINPGKHVAVVKAGTAEQKVEFALGEGEAKTVEVTMPAAAATPTPTPTPTPTTTNPPSTETRTSAGWLTWTGFSVGAAGFLVGSIAGAAALSQSGKLHDACDGGFSCPKSEAGAIRTYNATTTISTIGFIVGGIGVSVAVIDLATGATATKKTGSTHLSIGLGSLGLGGSF